MTPNFAMTLSWTQDATVGPGGFWTSTYPIMGTFGMASVTLVDAAAVAVVASAGGVQSLTCASNAVRVIGVPSLGTPGQMLQIVLINTSGGALTNTTFNAAIKQPAALTFPATTFNRTYFLRWDDTAGVWSLIGDSGADCAN